jgi:hypothetical protein
MNQSLINYTKIPMLVIFTIFTVMIYCGSADAGDSMMQTNLTNMADLMSKWSKELSSGKMEPKAQEKLGELLSLTSQVLRDLSANKSDDMNMEHQNKIQKMEKDWDPFDSSDKM